MKRLPIALLVLLIIMAGCSSTPAELPAEHSSSSSFSETSKSEATIPIPERIETMDTLMALVNRNHEAIRKPQIVFEDYVHSSSGEPFDIFAYSEGKEYDETAVLTAEQAHTDVDILFQALRSTYGPYYHFGGDEVFLKARDDILAECIAKERLSAGELSALLIKHLSFIRDAHFTVNNTRFSEAMKAHIYNQGTAYLRAGELFVTADGKKAVKTIAGALPEEMLRLSISSEGEVVYYPVMLLENGVDPETLEVEYTDGTRETLTPPQWESGYEESKITVEMRDRQGIPVLFARNMYFDQAPGGEDGQVFLDYAEQLGKAPVSMIDLRSNGGGNGILPLKWLSAFVGEQVTGNHLSIQRWSEEEMLAYGQDTENQYYVPVEEMQQYEGTSPINAQYMKNGDLPDTFVQNDSLLIVLTGKNTASAAEVFVDAAVNVENILLIGHNTFGMLISNAYTWMVLPESGIAIQLGSDLRVFADESFEEYAGFSPDIWVNGADAEDLAVKLVQNLME